MGRMLERPQGPRTPARRSAWRHVAALTVLLGEGISVSAADWPQYRGLNRDGASPEVIRTNWSEHAPRELWRKAIGQGFSSLAVSQGRIVTLEKRPVGGRNREFCVALAADSGAELWAVDLDAAQYTDLVGYDDRMDGPRSTPSIAGDRVYAFTAQLKLHALRVDTGAVVWRRDFPAELGSNVIAWENAASPLVVGDLVFVNCNARGQSLMAVRTSDGSTAWSDYEDAMTHASPVFARIGDVDQVVFLTRAGLISVVPETGDLLWRLPFSPSSTSTAASPAVSGEYVHASAAYASGTWIAHVTRNGDRFEASQAGRQQGNAYQLHWSTPAVHEGFYYCVPSPTSGQARLACLEAATGLNRWTQTTVGSGNIGYGSVIKAANALIVLTESGELVLVQPNPDAYTEIARHRVLGLYCWNDPVLANGRIYARSTSPTAPEIVAIDVAVENVGRLPPVALEAAIGSDHVRMVVTLRTLDGSALGPAHATQFELEATTELTEPPPPWTVLEHVWVPVGEALVTELELEGVPARFLRARAK